MDDIRKGAVNATASALSAPSVIRSKLSQAKAGSDFRVLKNANGYKGSPDRDADGSISDAFRARSVAEPVKMRLSKKKY